MNWIEHLMINHVLASHGVVLVMAALLARIDHLIMFALKIFSAQQIDAAIDKAATAAKAEIDKQAAQTPIQPKP